MKLTLILDPAPVGVRASLVEEWDEVARNARMEPRVRLFELGGASPRLGALAGAPPRAKATVPDRQQKKAAGG